MTSQELSDLSAENHKRRRGEIKPFQVPSGQLIPVVPISESQLHWYKVYYLDGLSSQTLCTIVEADNYLDAHNKSLAGHPTWYIFDIIEV